MKKSLLIICSILFTWATNAQIIFSGESPASIQGSYDMTYGDPGGGWGSPDLVNPANAVLDTLAQYLDVTAADSLGCDGTAANNDVDGKIAILYRGECEFGTKALNAENAGAIACVIINNVPGGPVGMAPGTDGGTITIPIVMIGDVDGATLLAEMQNGPVEVFIGNKTGFYPNDVGTLPSTILRAKQFATPSLVAQDGSEYTFDVGAWVYNFGFQDQTNVSLNATVDFGGSEIYNESATPEDIPAGDSVFFSLPAFSESSYSEGFYELNYTITSDSVEDYSFDNMITAEFAITESLYGYASLDQGTVLPNSTAGYRPIDPGTGNPIPEYMSCIHLQDANASRLAATGLTFASSKASDAADPSLEGEPINVVVYMLNDNFVDITSPGYSNPPVDIDEIIFEDYYYSADLPYEPVTANFEEPFALEDDQRYLFCVSTFNEELYFAHDPSMNYSWNQQNYLQPLFPIKAAGEWNLNGFGSETVPSVTLNTMDASLLNLQNEKLSINMNAYPSPVSDELTVDFNGYDVESIEMINLTGQRVAGQSIASDNTSTKIDVNGLENGVYIVKAYLSNGMVETMQVVVSH